MDEITLNCDELNDCIADIKKIKEQIGNVENKINHSLRELNDDYLASVEQMNKERVFVQKAVVIRAEIKEIAYMLNKIDKNLKKHLKNIYSKLELAEDVWQEKSLSVEMNMKSNFEDVDKEALKICKDTFKRDIPELSPKKLEKFFKEPKIQVMLTLVGGSFLITSKALQNIRKDDLHQYEAKDESSKLKSCELEAARKGVKLKKIRDLSKSGGEYYFNNILGNKLNSYDSREKSGKFIWSNIKNNYVYMENSLKSVDSSEIKKNINFSERYAKLEGKEFEGRDIKDIVEFIAKGNSLHKKKEISQKVRPSNTEIKFD